METGDLMKLGVGILITLVLATITIVVGANLAPTVIAGIVAVTSNASIGSFPGTSGMFGLSPFLFAVLILFIPIFFIAIIGYALVNRARGG